MMIIITGDNNVGSATTIQRSTRMMKTTDNDDNDDNDA